MGKGKSPLPLTILEVRTFITEDSIGMKRISAAVFSFDSVFLSSGIPQLAPSGSPADLTNKQCWCPVGMNRREGHYRGCTRAELGEDGRAGLGKDGGPWGQSPRGQNHSGKNRSFLEQKLAYSLSSYNGFQARGSPGQLTISATLQTWQFGGFPAGPGSKESTGQCRGHGFDPWSRRILHVTGPPLKPLYSRDPAPQQEKPQQHEARAPQPESSP